MIYKLLLPAEWEAFETAGRFDGSPVDIQDGFIHFSSPDQVRGTAAKHFADAPSVVLAEVDPALLKPEPVWEKSRGGDFFPHLYGVLPSAAVVRHWLLARRPDGAFDFPI
jgi:uncharacterized protein (DUF952 family)